MTTQIRLFVGGAVLAAGLVLLADAAAAPPLAADTYKKVAEADVAQLQSHLETINKDATQTKRYAPTAKALAVMIATYGDATGDAALKDAALKVAETIGKKDYKAAATAAKALAVKGGTPGKGTSLHAKTNLEEIMSPFRGGKVGGTNMEKDIRDFMNGKTPIDPAAIHILAARTAVIGELTAQLHNDKALVNPANKAKWEGWSKDMVDIGGKLATEAAKGKGANNTEIIKLLKGLDAKCSDCHNAFRD